MHRFAQSGCAYNTQLVHSVRALPPVPPPRHHTQATYRNDFKKWIAGCCGTGNTDRPDNTPANLLAACITKVTNFNGLISSNSDRSNVVDKLWFPGNAVGNSCPSYNKLALTTCTAGTNYCDGEALSVDYKTPCWPPCLAALIA